MPGTLYLVPTPIGNLGDISARMAETLETVDFIAAEDTRVTVKLLNHLGIKKPMVSYYRHNTDASGAAVLERLLAGENCALVTDAGTPGGQRPRRGSGGPVRRRRGAGGGYSRAVRPGHGSGRLGTSYRTLYL